MQTEATPTPDGRPVQNSLVEVYLTEGSRCAWQCMRCKTKRTGFRTWAEARENGDRNHQCPVPPEDSRGLADRAVAACANLTEAWAGLRMDSDDEQRLHDKLVKTSRATAAAYWARRRVELGYAPEQSQDR